MSVDRPLWKKWPLVYKMVIKSYLPSYLCDSSDASDSSDSSDCSDIIDSCDSNHQKTLVTKTIVIVKNCFLSKQNV